MIKRYLTHTPLLVCVLLQVRILWSQPTTLVPLDSIENKSELVDLRAELRHMQSWSEDQYNSLDHLWKTYEEIRRQSSSRESIDHLPDWKFIGPDPLGSRQADISRGGRMISVAFDPAVSDRIWAGSAEGGLFRSDDLGKSWTSSTDQLPVVGVPTIAFNPKDPSHMLIGTGEGKTSLPWILTMRPGIGVLQSKDGGVQWERTSFDWAKNDGISCFTLKWHPSDENVVYLAATNGFWRSDDGGSNWTMQKPGRCVDLAVVEDDPEKVLAVFQSDGVYLSNDRGESGSWTLLDNGLPTGGTIGFSSIDIHERFTNIIYISITNGDPICPGDLY